MLAWLGAALILGAVVSAAVAGMWLVRASASLEFLESHNEVAGFLYAVVGVLYAVLLAFVVTFVWERHSEAEARAALEANTLADLYREAQALPALSAELRALLREYTVTVIDEEWPLMARGEASLAAWETVDALWLVLADYQPQDAREALWYPVLIQSLDELGDYRRLRLLSSHQTVPAAMWVVLILGGLITVGFSFFFGAKNLWAQTLMVAALAGLVALILLLALALEHPFRGAALVDPGAFEQLLAIFERLAR